MPQIRCLTYNIRLALEEGFDSVLQTILAIKADIVALQEVGDCWPHGPQINLTKELALAANYPGWFFAGALFQNGGSYGIGLLSRWPLTAIQTRKMPQISDEQRVLLSARIPKIETRVWTTHVSVLREDRNIQLPWLTQKVSAEKPDILLGDMNTHPGDPLLAAIDMRNTFEDSPPLTYPSDQLQTTIDHIFHGPRYSVSSPGQVMPSSASDHLPVFSDLAYTS